MRSLSAIVVLGIGAVWPLFALGLPLPVLFVFALALPPFSALLFVPLLLVPPLLVLELLFLLLLALLLDPLFALVLPLLALVAPLELPPELFDAPPLLFVDVEGDVRLTVGASSAKHLPLLL